MQKTIPGDWDEDIPGAIDMDKVADVAMHGILAPEPKSRNKLATTAGPALPKLKRIRLDGEAYRTLRLAVLDRDGWRCRNCGTMRNLDVHHVIHRGRGGGDTAENCIAVCRDCHQKHHDGKLDFFP